MVKLTQYRVKELFDYHQDGYLIWKVNRRTVHLGDKAGSLAEHYYQVTIDYVTHLVHKVIFLWHHGYIPENDIDHINKIKTDNRIENLREISKSCNIKNSKLSKNNRSGIKGVSYYKKTNRWYVSMRIDNVSKNLGYYKDFDEAVCVRLAYEQCLGWNECDNNSTAYQYINLTGV